MARGTGCTSSKGASKTKSKPRAARRGRVPAGLTTLSYEEIQVSDRFASREAISPYKVPNDFEQQQAREFVTTLADQGVTIDPVIAYRLLKQRFDGVAPADRDAAYRNWLYPVRGLIRSPEKTCPGMDAAGAELAQALADGAKIAVFCDYDVDGTAAGAVFQRGTDTYLTSPEQLFYGYADAKRGFGLTNEFVEEAAAAGASYLITLDCGSGQADQVRLAQSLGMKVVIVDHHTSEGSEENPAEHHLNPLIHPGYTNKNTGAQLTWKLTAALQCAAEPDNRTRPDHWEEALYLAGAGCIADMADTLAHENRAFIWCAAEHAPAGIAELAAQLGEDASWPGQTVLTQATLNLPKRSPLVDAADSGAVCQATTAVEAEPLIERMLAQYAAAAPVRKALVDVGLAKAGGPAIRDSETNELYRPNPDELVAMVVLDESDLAGVDASDYVGYTGPASQRISSLVDKPTLVFLPRGSDEFGQVTYKFSGRNAAKGDYWLGLPDAAAKLGPKTPFIDNWDVVTPARFVQIEAQAKHLGPFIYNSSSRVKLGELIVDPKLREATMLKKRNESGEIVEAPSLGGHVEVVSGACTVENIDAVKAAVNEWAAKAAADYSKRDKPKPGPANFQPEVAIEAVLTVGEPDPKADKWLVGSLDFGEGVVREVRFPADVAAPVGRRCEWLIKLGKSGPFFIRKFRDLDAPAAD